MKVGVKRKGCDHKEMEEKLSIGLWACPAFGRPHAMYGTKRVLIGALFAFCFRANGEWENGNQPEPMGMLVRVSCSAGKEGPWRVLDPSRLWFGKRVGEGEGACAGGMSCE